MHFYDLQYVLIDELFFLNFHQSLFCCLYQVFDRVFLYSGCRIEISGRTWTLVWVLSLLRPLTGRIFR